MKYTPPKVGKTEYISDEEMRVELDRIIEGVYDYDTDPITEIEPLAEDWYELYDKMENGQGYETLLGFATAVESGEYLNDFGDRIDFWVFKIRNQFFRVEGWSNSWSGDGEVNHEDVHEVVQQKVTRYEYLRKGNGNGNSNEV